MAWRLGIDIGGTGIGRRDELGADPERMRVVTIGQSRADDLREQIAPVDLVADRPGAIEINRRTSGRPRNRKRHQPHVMRLVTTFQRLSRL